MKKEAKKFVIDELKEELSKSNALFVFNFKGLTVSNISEVRESIIESKGMVRVAKNKLMGIAVKGTPFEKVSDALQDNNAFVFSYDDPIGISKVMVEMAEKFDKLQLKTAAFEDGTYYDADNILALSKIPGKDELIGQLLYMMNYPIQGLVTSLSGIMRNLVVVLDQVKEQKETV